MPYARRSVRAGSNTGTGRSTRFRKKPSTTLRKVYTRRPTAQNQKRQIARVTRLALANRKRFKTVYTDWQTNGVAYIDSSTPGSWNVFRLSDVMTWVSVLRQDTNVNESSHTFVKRLQVNYTSWITQGYAHVNIFVVRPRYPAANKDPATGMVINEDYVHNPNFQYANLRLNAGKFKVLYSAYKFLMVDSMGNTGGGIPGDPTDTFMNRQINLNVNIKVAQAATTDAWHKKVFEAMPYYDKLYLLVQQSSGAFQFDSIATCVNTL